MYFGCPQGCLRTSMVCPSPLTVQKWHKKRFSRDVSNTKVVPICVINKMVYILDVPRTSVGINGTSFSFDSLKVAQEMIFPGRLQYKCCSYMCDPWIVYILDVPKDVCGHQWDVLFLWQSKSGTRNDFRGTSPTQKLFLYVWSIKWSIEGGNVNLLIYHAHSKTPLSFATS